VLWSNGLWLNIRKCCLAEELDIAPSSKVFQAPLARQEGLLILFLLYFRLHVPIDDILSGAISMVSDRRLQCRNRLTLNVVDRQDVGAQGFAEGTYSAGVSWQI
jgi:hypothetical protein